MAVSMDKSRKFAALILIAVILTCFSGNVWAQYDEGENPLYVPEPKTFYAGLLLGSNLAQVDGDNFAGYHKAGINVGGIGYVHLRKHLAVSWEILYSQKGSKSDMVKFFVTDSTIIVKKYNINLNYAEIPVMINYFDQRKSHFGVGVSYSRLVSTTETSATIPSTSIDFTKYPFQKNNFDIIAGANLHLWKGLFLNVRFQYGLVPIRTVSPPQLSRAQKQYNNMWTVRLMYLFI